MSTESMNFDNYVKVQVLSFFDENDVDLSEEILDFAEQNPEMYLNHRSDGTYELFLLEETEETEEWSFIRYINDEWILEQEGYWR